jgi:general secretion pathway protein D
MIVEATIDRLKDIGTKWRAMATSDGEPVAIGGFGNISSNSLLSLISGLSGFSAGGMGNFLSIPLTTIGTDGTVTTSDLTVPGFAALFSMNEFKDVINVLSTPQILTSDNEEAEIVVGENVPFISKRERDITTTNTVLSSIERKDVGITLSNGRAHNYQALNQDVGCR